MQVTFANTKDKQLIYSLYNTSLSDDVKSIDYFFNEKYDSDNFLIYKEDDVVLCALEFSNKLVYFNGHNIEAKNIERVVYSLRSSKELKDEFIKSCILEFSKTTLLTLSDKSYSNFLNFEPVFKKKRYRLDRSELFNVDGYSISEIFDLKDIHKLYTSFIEHFDLYIKRDIQYFEDYLKELELDNYEIYVTRNSENDILGYIVYNYVEGELEVVDIAYMDTLALLTLLNQAMGMNSHIYISVSLSESLERVFGSLKYKLEFNKYLLVNDINLYKRLFNITTNSVLEYAKKSEFLIYL